MILIVSAHQGCLPSCSGIKRIITSDTDHPLMIKRTETADGKDATGLTGRTESVL
jgi:hypothetical protein